MKWLLLAWAFAEKQFLVMTLPTLRQIAYVALPDPVLRVLVIKDLVAPRSLALDAGLFRLYVTDSAQQKVFWYQLSVQGDKLITDGTQHIALESVETNNIAVDGAGNLYFFREAARPAAAVARLRPLQELGAEPAHRRHQLPQRGVDGRQHREPLEFCGCRCHR